MVNKTKVLYLHSALTIKDQPSADDTESIYIEGYASTNDIDRAGDVVSSLVWEQGMKNYLANPIILAQHDHSDPIGRMEDHKIDGKGLWIRARISAAAECYKLIKDGVLTAFSIGFRILDAEYNSIAEVFLIKEVELMEISVVSVPCNQNTLFSLAKAFDDADEYKEFKKQFAPVGTPAKGLETLQVANDKPPKGRTMTPEEIQKMLEEAASKAAAQATSTLLAEQAKVKAEAEANAAKEAEMAAKIKTAVEAQITLGQSGAEKLIADLTARVEAAGAESAKALDGLRAEVAAKAEEIAVIKAAGASKMTFSNGKDEVAKGYTDRESAVLLSRIMGKSITDTKFGNDLATKTGAHLPSATWELEVSMNMEAEVRRRLVVAPLLRQLAMKTNVMTIPINPEAGLGTWMANSAFGTVTSTGAAGTHALKEITLNAYKVATLEYVAYEEEEDSLLVLLPIIRDGMIRRVARAVDRAFIYGAGAGSDPVKGLALYDATSVVVPTNTGVSTIANLRALRKDLGAWGLDPSEIVYVVSTEVYYDLLDDTSFQTMNQVGVQATLLTGQVGSLGNTPVLVSGELPTKAGGAATASTNIGAFCLAPANFIAGNQRGLRFDTQDLAETQRKVLVASLRTGLTQTTTNLGPGISVLRWS